MQTHLKDWTHALLEWLGVTTSASDTLDRWVAFVLVLLAAVVFDVLLRLGIVRSVRKLVERTRVKWDDTLFSVPVLNRMCHILSAVLLAVVLPVVFEEKSAGRIVVLRLMQVYTVIAVLRFVNALLFAAFHIAAARPAWQNKPIKGLRQTAQGIALLISGIMIISILLNKSPTILLTGLGASAAVLMLIFRDSILGFVSGIQLSANDMLKVGDWISVPKYGADGNVVEVSLTTVKIRNWDNTLVMLPPYLLTTDSFTNWHAMQLSGGRRVMRSVSIDMTSVRFCTPEMLDHYRTIDLVRDYVDQTERRIEEYNAAHGIRPGERKINGLHQTNLGVFRAYLVRYLQNEVPVNPEMTLMVRQLEPSGTGLPMQLYFFTNTVVWVDYEGIQSDVFDHVLAVIPEFGLRVFQNPSGEDIASLRRPAEPTSVQNCPQSPTQKTPDSQTVPQSPEPQGGGEPKSDPASQTDPEPQGSGAPPTDQQGSAEPWTVPASQNAPEPQSAPKPSAESPQA